MNKIAKMVLGLALFFAAEAALATTCVHNDQVFNQHGEKVVTCVTASRTPVKIDIANQFGGASYHRVCNSLIDPLPISGLVLFCIEGLDVIGPIDPTLWTDVDCTGAMSAIGGVFVDNYLYHNVPQFTVKTIALDYDMLTNEVTISVVGEGTVPLQLHSGFDPFEVGVLLPVTYTGSVGEFTEPDNGCEYTLQADPGLVFYKLR